MLKIWIRVVIELQDDCKTNKQKLFLQNKMQKNRDVHGSCLFSDYVYHLMYFAQSQLFVNYAVNDILKIFANEGKGLGSKL